MPPASIIVATGFKAHQYEDRLVVAFKAIRITDGDVLDALKRVDLEPIGFNLDVITRLHAVLGSAMIAIESHNEHNSTEEGQSNQW